MNNLDELKEYNFGEAYYEEIPEDLIPKYAILFGEGSKKLTELLLFCWNNNIRTFSCCKGHYEKKDQGYIGFLPDEELAKYLIEIADQIMSSDIQIDNFNEMLRVTFYVSSELDFKVILNLIQKYVQEMKNGYQYNTRFPATSSLIDEVMSSNEYTLITIKNGKKNLYKLNEGKISLIEKKDYCPNSSITHILHSKITGELSQAFSQTSGKHL